MEIVIMAAFRLLRCVSSTHGGCLHAAYVTHGDAGFELEWLCGDACALCAGMRLDWL